MSDPLAWIAHSYTRYLADLLRRFENDAVLALAGDHAGADAVERYDRRGPPVPADIAEAARRYQRTSWRSITP